MDSLADSDRDLPQCQHWQAAAVIAQAQAVTSVHTRLPALALGRACSKLASQLRCAHGEYSEYPTSTLVPRPDY